uniref:SH3 domain-containing protein n=1 Tax=Cyclopterus lumpus TaxID=8103 RepID=A0A8C2ZCG8_CYCLU
RYQSDADLEVLRRRLSNAPRPLKKRSSITEPEGPQGPNIQKLLYQSKMLLPCERSSGRLKPSKYTLGRSCAAREHVSVSPPSVPQAKRTNLKKPSSERTGHGLRVKFNPLALLLDASLEGEFDLVQRIIYEVENPSMPNDEGITPLHNAVCAGHHHIVKFLLDFGVNVNAADSDGWTPLHCAASCNSVHLCKMLVESGAAIFATTISDVETAADKCEEMEEGYTQCSQFLYGVQEKLGVMNKGLVYTLWDYTAQQADELSFSEGDALTVLRRRDDTETEWWWARLNDHEGYIPRNLLGLYPRIKPRQRSLA